jgi:hypothetical protein
MVSISYAQEKDYKAYTLYVYNFMKYIEWPENDSKGDFIIALIGSSPIENEFRTLSKSKKLKGRDIVFKKFNSIEDIDNCHLIFVASKQYTSLKNINSVIKQKSILLVSENEGGAYKGASISFAVTDDDELSFDINRKELEEHKLKISSTLVNLGNVVK